jgi:integrase
MQLLRKVHRFATQFWGTDDNELPFGRCPVDKVNIVHRQWAKTAPRTRKLGDGDIGPWLKAVRDLPHTQKRGDGQLAAHFLELMLLTGLRRREAAFLRWADVDLRRLTLTVRHTKNKTDHTLPITRRVKAILEERQQALIAAQDRAKRHPNPTNRAHADDLSEYVIGLEETRHQIALIEAQTGILVGAHDLRRTWASLADKCGVGGYAIKAALNHATTNEVTGTHYAQVDTGDLREPLQKVEDYILAKLAAATGENVIPWRPAREVAA